MVPKSHKAFDSNLKENLNKIIGKKKSNNVIWVSVQMKKEPMKSYIHCTKILLLKWQSLRGAKYVHLSQISTLSTWIFSKLMPIWIYIKDLQVTQNFRQILKNANKWLIKCWKNGPISSLSLNLYAKEVVASVLENSFKDWKNNILGQWMISKPVYVFEIWLLLHLYSSFLCLLKKVK